MKKFQEVQRVMLNITLKLLDQPKARDVLGLDHLGPLNPKLLQGSDKLLLLLELILLNK